MKAPAAVVCSRLRFQPVLLCLVLWGGALQAADPETPAPANGELEHLDQLQIVGQRTRSRSVLESAVPVDVVSRETLERNGRSETSRLLQFIIPSFNFSTSIISDGTDTVRPATLRGLGPDQVLVLINGKRRHTSALMHINGSIGRGTSGTDLNAIPASAIDRIEVLRDGAAAQYGSDAIAGVINVILKRDPGSTLQMDTGQTYSGDGENLQGAINQGFSWGESGFLNVDLEYRKRNRTNRAGPDPRQQYPFLEQIRGQPALTSGTLDPREASFDRLSHRFGDADSKNVYLWANGAVDITPNTEVYLFGGLSRRYGRSGGFYRRPGDARNVPEVHPDGFLPLLNTNVDDDSASLGVRHRFGEWHSDVSVTYGRNSFNFFISDSVNVSLGPQSPTQADSGTLRVDQVTLNLDLNRSLEVGLPGPLFLATGFELRRDAYQIEAGEFASYANGPEDDPASAFTDQYGGVAPPGIQVLPGFRPGNEVNERRYSVAAYVDLETDLNDRFTLGVAGRVEHFSDFGATVNGKLSGRFELTPLAALRGSVSTGFRAPSLQQEFFNNTSTQFVTVGNEIVPLEVGTFATGSPVRAALGIKDLRDETSVNVSFGVVLDGGPWELTTDFYRIAVNDRAVLSGRFLSTDPVIADLLTDFPGDTAAQFVTNAIDTRTHGVDVVGGYTVQFNGGASLRLDAAFNWSQTRLHGAVRTPPELAGLGATLFDRQEQIFLEKAQPRTALVAGANYRVGDWDLSVNANRFGRVTSTESAEDPTRDQTFSAEWILDVNLAYRLSEGLRLALGVNNALDNTPDRQIAINSFNGIFPFNRRASPINVNGGFYYTRLSWHF